MGFLDKLYNFTHEDVDTSESSKSSNEKSSKKKKFTDIFFEDVEETSDTDSKKKKGKWTDIFFESEEEQDKPKRSLIDFLYEDEEDDVKSTFVEGDEKVSVLNDISSQIERRESELVNLADFFKTVNSAEYPDSSSEYEAYLSLIKQLKDLKELSTASQGGILDSVANYQFEDKFKRFEASYKEHINAIQSLCYLSEVSSLNDDMINLFNSDFNSKTEHKLEQIEEYITLISAKSDGFDKKYTTRLFKELIEAEYRLTILKLMNEIRVKNAPRNNPFDDFSSEKKKTFETYLSKDIRDSSIKYNTIADNKFKYVKYDLVQEDYFDKLDSDAETISEEINGYTIDDFSINELFEDGDGYETLKKFLRFKLVLNFIDSKTQLADELLVDDKCREIDSKKKKSSFPDFDEDL